MGCFESGVPCIGGQVANFFISVNFVDDMRVKDWVSPALVLFLLSPVVGELLSGSSPPAEFFTVFGFTVMSLLYGCGAILCRELKVRWRKGIGTLILLGAAYGVIEEGLMVASFQNPGWGDLGVLSVFGRVWGVNWVWAVELTIYHTFVSIVIPVLLVEQLYPERRGESWLSGKWKKIIPALFILDVIFGYFIFAYTANYRPPIPQYVFFILITICLVAGAHRLPMDWARKGNEAIVSPRRIIMVTFVAMFTSAIIFGVLPNIVPENMFPVIIILGLALVLIVIRWLKRFNWYAATPNHWLALAVGPLLLMILLSVFQEMDGSRLDDTSGMSMVGLFFLVSLIWMWRRNR